MDDSIMHNPINEGQNLEVPMSKSDSGKTHHGGKKRLKDYLQEGLMIFVAVVMGFLAENVREAIGNREKERQYMASYLKNLQEDSSALAGNISDNNRKLAYLDSLLNLSQKDISTPSNRANFYKYCIHTVSYYSEFGNNDATFLQLAYSGGLRLIKKDHVADSIAKYAAELKGVYAAEGLYTKAINDATMAAHEVLDYTVVYDSSYYKGKNYTGKYIPLVSDDKQKMKLLFNKISFERTATELYISKLNSLRPFLEGFIDYLKKEYSHE
jgi:hypothetical protein